MPTPEEILAALTAIASDWMVVAIAWHALIAIVLGAVAFGWRPSYRLATLLIALLPASVAVFAFAYGNPFNGVVFTATALALATLAVGDSRGAIRNVPRWTFWGGIAMVAFGWAYPHFLEDRPLAYLYAAPVGLVPCPSLSMAIGLALLAGGGGRRAWRLTLAGVGLFYGAYGVARLGVAIDVFLALGSAWLAATAFKRVPTPVAGQRHSALAAR
jgi:hypothetical protein